MSIQALWCILLKRQQHHAALVPVVCSVCTWAVLCCNSERINMGIELHSDMLCFVGS